MPEVAFGRGVSPQRRSVDVWVDEVRVVPIAEAQRNTLVEETSEALLQRSLLLPNVPNPFNAETLVRYQVGGSSRQPVVLRIYDLAGQVVRTLV